MDRRKFLRNAGLLSTTALAGCINDPPTTDVPTDTDTDTPPTTPTQTPEPLRGVYVAPHMDEMKMIGMTTAANGRLKIAVSYALPHEFYLVTGPRFQQIDADPRATMHLMVSIWDTETTLTPPQAEPTVTISRDGEELTSLNPWPMLSQPMGYHFGDNVSVRGDGNYTFDIELNNDSSTMPSSLEDVFSETTVSLEKQFDPASALELGEMASDNPDDPGAIPPMEMDMMPVPQQPQFEDIPVELTDGKLTNGARVAVGTTDAAEFGVDSEQYLVVATQSQYNRYMLPLMSVAATITRDGDELYSDTIDSSLHPDIGHFYGAGVPELQPGDEVVIVFQSPPQTSRHIGYEESFRRMETLNYTI